MRRCWSRHSTMNRPRRLRTRYSKWLNAIGSFSLPFLFFSHKLLRQSVQEAPGKSYAFLVWSTDLFNCYGDEELNLESRFGITKRMKLLLSLQPLRGVSSSVSVIWSFAWHFRMNTNLPRCCKSVQAASAKPNTVIAVRIHFFGLLLWFFFSSSFLPQA